MKLYNTLSRSVEDIRPIDGHKYKMYSCGPTVYNHIHIGNLSSFIYADIIRRALSSEAEVTHVMNFTDVDDKTINASKTLFPEKDPLLALKDLTQEYIDIFVNDMVAVGNNVEAIEFIKATDNIEEMQQLITELLEADIAYIVKDGIYFSIEKYIASGKKYGQLLDLSPASTSEARIQNDEYDKESVHDFVLWKTQKASEPAWDFKIDGQNYAGRPGWHIECSAMSKKLLGQPFDIHTGGVDLIFPHHENEIAQSTAASSEQIFAKTFVHNEHLLVDGKKMSKSLDNFHTLQDIKLKGLDPIAFRLLVLQAHYKSQAHFSWDNLIAANNRLKDYRAMAALRWQVIENNNDAPSFAMATIHEQIAEFLRNDLDTPNALSLLSSISTQLQTVLIDSELKREFERLLTNIDDLLGLQLFSVKDINQEQKQLLEARERSREQKDWESSDNFRVQLVEQGIGLRDTAHGAIWFWL